ncbi:unnamed protein product [Caenorhabditis sp. 36 PRJEB53466]|nr:unnamed protein product [Caenorhabditis sp. 36 PRJEB53466]
MLRILKIVHRLLACFTSLVFADADVNLEVLGMSDRSEASIQGFLARLFEFTICLITAEHSEEQEITRGTLILYHVSSLLVKNKPTQKYLIHVIESVTSAKTSYPLGTARYMAKRHGVQVKKEEYNTIIVVFLSRLFISKRFEGLEMEEAMVDNIEQFYRTVIKVLRRIAKRPQLRKNLDEIDCIVLSDEEDEPKGTANDGSARKRQHHEGPGPNRHELQEKMSRYEEEDYLGTPAPVLTVQQKHQIDQLFATESEDINKTALLQGKMIHLAVHVRNALRLPDPYKVLIKRYLEQKKAALSKDQ